MKNKTGYFIVIDGEKYEDAYKEHYTGYSSITHALSDAATYLNDEAKFQIFDNEREPIGSYVIKNGKPTEIK